MINFIMYFSMLYEKKCIYYEIGGSYVSDQAGLNRGPLILNSVIVTLYKLCVRIE